VARFKEKMGDASIYGKGTELLSLIKDRMAPFYGKMDREAKAIHPDSPRLREIHAGLLQYLELMNKFLTGYLALTDHASSLVAATQAASEKVDDAMQAVEKAAKSVDAAGSSAPQVAAQVVPVIQDGLSRLKEFQIAIDAVRTGRLDPARFRQFVEQRVQPYLDRSEKEVDAFKSDLAGAVVVTAAKGFFQAARGMVQAGLDLADQAKGKGSAGDLPTQDSLQTLWKSAEQARTAYQEDAKRYREGLK
jgi:hypothetical protein